MTDEATTIDNGSIKMFGILNADGEFWSFEAFHSEFAARQHVRAFWRGQPAMAEQCLREFKFVPVRVQMTVLTQKDKS